MLTAETAEIAKNELGKILGTEVKTSKPTAKGEVKYVKTTTESEIKQHQLRALAHASEFIPGTMSLKRSGKGITVLIGKE